MGWPLSQDYNEAVQNPASCFCDPDLAGGEAVCNAMGLPVPCSGNFADVYQIQRGNGTRWAVKCFTRQVPGLRSRYAAIGEHLRQAGLPFMVDFSYLGEGIRVGGRWYPVVKMRWVQGGLLNEFVHDALDKPAVLGALLHIWVRMARRLRAAGVAHGDLQHGNIILVPEGDGSLTLRLIDYDGMFVPALAGQKSGEVGHPSYQHPQRLQEGTYGPEVDRFPLLVVAAALRCLQVGGRRLWERYDNGDNLLFKEGDFRAPHQSPLFAELLKLPDPEARSVAARLMAAAQKPLEQTPLLEEVFPEKPAPVAARSPTVYHVPPPVPVASPAAVSPLPVQPVQYASSVTPAGRLVAGSRGSPNRRQKLTLSVVLGGGVLALLLVGGLALWGALSKPASNSRSTEGALAGTDQRGMASRDARVRAVEPGGAGKTPEPVKRSPVDSPGPKPEPDPGRVEDSRPKPLDCTGDNGISAAEVRRAQEAWAKYLGRQVEETVVIADGVTMTFVLVPPGKFRMGSPAGEQGRNPSKEQDWDVEALHEVTLTEPFDMGKTEMTQVQYQAVPGHDPGGGIYRADMPMDAVSWHDACAYAEKLTKRRRDGHIYRLPTEAEWEYACRGGRPSSMPFGVGDGRTLSPQDANFSGNFLFRRAGQAPAKCYSPVGSYPANALGLFDMHGNVWEWCADWYGPYPQGSVTNPPGPAEGSRKVVRGGCFIFSATDCRAARRLPAELQGFGQILPICGFRLARSVPSRVQLVPRRPEPVPTQRVKVLRAPASANGPPACAAFSPRGDRLVAGGLGSIRVWDMTSDKEIHSFQLGSALPISVAFTHDAKHIIVKTLEGFGSVSSTLSVTLWNLQTWAGKEIFKQPSRDEHVACIGVSASGKKALTASYEKSPAALRVWDLDTGLVICGFHTPPNTWPTSTVFSPDTKTVVTGLYSRTHDDNLLILWDAQTGKEIQRFIGHVAAVGPVAFSPDGTCIASSADKTAYLWDTATGRKLHQLKLPSATRGLTFSPDGRFLVTACGVFAQLWDVQTGKHLTDVENNYSGIVIFSPDGKRLLTNGREQGELVLTPWSELEAQFK
jgi:formylglycine-generating enzyme required for sulfatase activity/DNA-binding beta-propeller fold protein YncE